METREDAEEWVYHCNAIIQSQVLSQLMVRLFHESQKPSWDKKDEERLLYYFIRHHVLPNKRSNLEFLEDAQRRKEFYHFYETCCRGEFCKELFFDTYRTFHGLQTKKVNDGVAQYLLNKLCVYEKEHGKLKTCLLDEEVELGYQQKKRQPGLRKQEEHVLKRQKK